MFKESVQTFRMSELWVNPRGIPFLHDTIKKEVFVYGRMRKDEEGTRGRRGLLYGIYKKKYYSFH
jgi:hypothetical protein